MIIFFYCKICIEFFFEKKLSSFDFPPFCSGFVMDKSQIKKKKNTFLRFEPGQSWLLIIICTADSNMQA